MASTLNPLGPLRRADVSVNAFTGFDGIGVLLLTATLTFTNGVWGLLVGLLVFVLAVVRPGPAAFVVAQLGVVSLLSVSAPFTVAATQIAAFFLLASVAYSRSADWRQLGELAGGYLVSLGTAWALLLSLRWLWQAALVFVLLAAVAAYALHRYERVALGLVRTEVDQ